MIFIFDENYSYRLANGINALEEGNTSLGVKPSKVYHIIEFARSHNIFPKEGNPTQIKK